MYFQQLCGESHLPKTIISIETEKRYSLALLVKFYAKVKGKINRARRTLVGERGARMAESPRLLLSLAPFTPVFRVVVKL